MINITANRVIVYRVHLRIVPSPLKQTKGYVMKRIIISGSLAYDRIMNFSDKFSNHILPDKIHNINVCFQVDGVTENYGGTAGNIAYALRLMGEKPFISATIGHDYHNYFKWLEKNDIPREGIRIIPEEFTAGAYITTDKGNNQITGFNPGAMKYSSGLDTDLLAPGDDLLIVSPGNLDDMINYPRLCAKTDVKYIFDPGQSLPMLEADDLHSVIKNSMILIVNDYEFTMIQEKTGLTREELLNLPRACIITLGELGSTIYRQGETVQIPACTASKVVDPTGAGDSFRGGLISGLINGRDIVASARLGSAIASFAVESAGTQVYTFSAGEFESRLAAI